MCCSRRGLPPSSLPSFFKCLSFNLLSLPFDGIHLQIVSTNGQHLDPCGGLGVVSSPSIYLTSCRWDYGGVVVKIFPLLTEIQTTNVLFFFFFTSSYFLIFFSFPFSFEKASFIVTYGIDGVTLSNDYWQQYLFQGSDYHCACKI